MKLGSLFDGSGGFPLAGVMNGIEPVWASEIEPYPLRVTAARFPQMKQLGDVTKINGAGIEKVDIITFGSPCQDLSVAGKQKGIHEGERSNLFFEAVRIIKEMREDDRAAGRADEHIRPRFAVWENVPGAFSSNKGRDFQAVLQALCEVADPDASVPFPEKGKWSKAGCIVGDGYSIAWRVYDAQYWGVPQRRKRIYLIADFGSERAGEILFERESMRRYPETSREAREGAAADAEGSASGDGHSVCFGIGSYHSNAMRSDNPYSGFYEAKTSRTLDLNGGNPTCNQGGVAIVQFYQNENVSPTPRVIESGSNQTPDVVYVLDQQGGKGGANYAKDVVPTICSDSHGTPHGIVYPRIARTLTAEHDSSPCVDRGQNVVVFAAGFADGLGEKAQGGMEYTEEKSPTLRAGDARAVVYDCRGNGTGGGVTNVDR